MKQLKGIIQYKEEYKTKLVEMFINFREENERVLKKRAELRDKVIKVKSDFEKLGYINPEY